MFYDELKRRLEEAKTERNSLQMGINFGNHVFSEPKPIHLWSPPYRAGLYAFLVPDRSCKPLPFRVIYFGESSNLSERGFFQSHHKYWSLILEAGSEKNLYISVYPLPYSTSEQRRAIETQLIEHYHPVCNTGYAELSLLAKMLRT